MVARSVGGKTRGRPRKADGRDTRQEILKESLDLFASKTFPDTSIREIARAVGISEAAIYGHFSSKQDILVGLFETFGPGAALRLFEGFDKRALLSDPVGTVTALVLEFFDHFGTAEVMKLLKVHAMEAIRTGGSPAAAIESMECRVEKAVTEIFVRLQQEDVIEDVNPSLLAIQLLSPVAMVRFQLMKAKTGFEGIEQSRELMKEHVGLFFHRILKVRLGTPQGQ